jgi:hypothetical protein
MSKQELREMKWLAQNHKTDEEHSWDLNLDF